MKCNMMFAMHAAGGREQSHSDWYMMDVPLTNSRIQPCPVSCLIPKAMTSLFHPLFSVFPPHMCLYFYIILPPLFFFFHSVSCHHFCRHILFLSPLLCLWFSIMVWHVLLGKGLSFSPFISQCISLMLVLYSTHQYMIIVHHWSTEYHIQN